MESIVAVNGVGTAVGQVGVEVDHGLTVDVKLAEYRRADGKIVIAGWLFTHDHGDHTGFFSTFVEKYSSKDAILAARAAACIGDAYVGLENYSKALGYFEKAAAAADNMFAATYLLKAGVTAEKLGDNAKAVSFYKTIKEEYPQSMEGYDIDKYIGRIEAK